MALLNGVHAFGYNSAGSEPIWMKFGYSEYIVYRWRWQIYVAIRAEGRAIERSKFLFFLSSKQRATLQISDQPIFTQFAHKTWI